MDVGLRRCAQCWREFRDTENGEAACLYHPGKLLDYDRLGQPGVGAAGDLWDCCLRQVQPDSTPLDVP